MARSTRRARARQRLRDWQRRRPREAGIRALLSAYTIGDPDETLPLQALLSGLGRQVFGMLLFIASLPAFIPVPGVAGAISGPLTIVVGAQLMIGMRRPWLPRALSRRGPQRASLVRFERRIAPWLDRLEYLVRPRLTIILDNRLASMFTGLLLVLLGILLALPIPFTNFLFGAIMLTYALALIERDGILMLLCWVGGIIAIAVFGVLSGALAAAAAHWIGQLF